MREYVWFGLTPIAVRRAGEGGEVDRCSEDVLTKLRDRLTTRQATLVTVTERVTRLTDTLGTRQATEADVQARRDTVADRLANLPDNLPEREAELTARITTLDARLTQLDGVVMDVETRLADAQLRLAELEVLVADLTERVTRREARCARLAANSDGTDIVTTGDGGPQLNYIHADHLGRPAFVTDTTGAVLWDAGITTPFGVSIETQAIGDAVQTTAALMQPIMFPGQYRDTETGYHDNWHRTYDPALGRYLQSDPIGLGGGLNRYAYVGGNPLGFIDPTGLGYVPPGVEGHGNLTTLRGGPSTWYVIDLDPALVGPGQPNAECRCGADPRPDEDVDFVYVNGTWLKILTGDMRVAGDSYRISPERVYRGKGPIKVSIPAAFPAGSPPLLYRLNNLPGRIIKGNQTPSQYLKSLKSGVPSCSNMPS